MREETERVRILSTDLFVKVWASSVLRLGMAMSVIERCLLLDDARVHVIICDQSLMPDELMKGWFPKLKSWCDLPAEKFWISSKALAEDQAKSDPYVVLDDDHLPIGKTWLADGLRHMDSHPEYGCFSSWSINGEVPEGPVSGVRGEFNIWESTCTGTPYFIRKGILKPNEMPDGPLPNYDATLSEHIRSQCAFPHPNDNQGADHWKIGFLRNVRHNHLGYGFSQVIPGWWKA